MPLNTEHYNSKNNNILDTEFLAYWKIHNRAYCFPLLALNIREIGCIYLYNVCILYMYMSIISTTRNNEDQSINLVTQAEVQHATIIFDSSESIINVWYNYFTGLSGMGMHIKLYNLIAYKYQFIFHTNINEKEQRVFLF